MKLDEITKILSALSNESRLRIFSLLKERELCVCELESALGLSQSLISHALRTLKEAGLVEVRTEGRWKIYEIPPAIRKISFVSGLLEEIVLEKSDVEGLKRCSEEGVRDRCG